MVVVHLDKFVQINCIEVKHNAQMVAPHEVVLEFDDAFNLIWVVFLEEEEQLGFNGCLIVVLFLVLDHLDGDHSFGLVVLALQDLAKSALAD